ncbi:MAG: DUF2304 domain-containing protein [Lachnospiraceae bacterium]|nr:DUF2304 domain-containing protein [Lachnospiraceae bacterium]
MSFKLQIFIAVITVIALLYIGNKVRNRVIELKYALVWFFVAILFLILDIFPNILQWLSQLLGIVLPVNMLMFFGFGFILLILYTFTVVLTNQDRRIKRLIQEEALLAYRVDELERELQKKDFKVRRLKTRTADGGPEHKVKIIKKNTEESK